MPEYAGRNTTTGIVEEIATLPADQIAQNQPGPGCEWVEIEPGTAQPGAHYINDGAILDLPPRPGPWAVFDLATEAWIDPRTPAEIDADDAAALNAARDVARAHVMARVEAIRKAYITALAGQEMIYMAKEAEALRYAGETDLTGFPMLAAEVGITAPTAADLAALWIATAHQWRAVAAQLEAARMTARAALDAATTQAGIDAAVAALDAALAPLQPGAPT